jgi:hypothetical protein
MPSLRPSQSRLLRYWAMTMAAVRYNWIGFGYTPFELQRFKAIVGEAPVGAYSVWMIVTAALFCLVAVASTLLFLGPLVVAPGIAPTPVFVGALGSMIVFAFTFGLPFAMAVGGRIADVLFHVPPFKEADGDAALYGKIRFQIGRFAIFGVVAVGLLIGLDFFFGIDVTQYAGDLRWIYYVVLLGQAIMGLVFIGRRP